jgi:MFS family permease
MYLAAAVALFAAIAAWSTDEAPRRRLAIGAIAGIAIAGLGAGVLGARATHEVAAPGWRYIAIAGAAAAIAGWVMVLRGQRAGLAVATAATAATVLAGAVVREAPRLALIEPVESARAAGGLVVFAITFALGIAAVAWIVRTIRAA